MLRFRASIQNEEKRRTEKKRESERETPTQWETENYCPVIISLITDQLAKAFIRYIYKTRFASRKAWRSRDWREEGSVAGAGGRQGMKAGKGPTVMELPWAMSVRFSARFHSVIRLFSPRARARAVMLTYLRARVSNVRYQLLFPLKERNAEHVSCNIQFGFGDIYFTREFKSTVVKMPRGKTNPASIARFQLS